MKRKIALLCCLLLAILAAAAAADSGEEEKPWTVEGDRLIIREGVRTLGGIHEEDWTEEDMDPGIPEEDLYCPSLYIQEDFPSGIREIVLPSTLRVIEMESLCELTGQDVVLNGPVEFVSEEAFCNGWIRRLILGRDYTGNLPGLYNCSIREWEAEEGNPRYSSRDGVLFSADGETLIAYAAGSDALHYDVPAGTKTIGAGAFNDEDMGIPLQTISLPIGLRRIEAYAFAGCGRLHSLTVPLTVTELDPSAFANCVSLERLSLPPGMTASWGEDYALHEDPSRYMGDNGGTLTEPRETDNFDRVRTETRVTAAAWLSGEDGEGPVAVYDSPAAETPARRKQSGTRVTYFACSGGRARIWDYGDISWIDLDRLLPAGSEPFFEISRVVPTEEGLEELRRKGLEQYSEAYFDDENDLVGRFYGRAEAPGEEDPEAELPFRLVRLYRPRTGDSRVLGMLVTEEAGQAIRLLDAPEGACLGWTYRGEQAEVLETREEWARIRTIALTGWIRTENLMIAEQEPGGGETDSGEAGERTGT